MAFVLIIDGADFSDCIMQKNDIQETPDYINGPNAGTSKVGTPIWDRVNTAYSYQIPIKPLTRARYAALAAACEPNEVTLTYNTVQAAAPRTVRAQLALSRIQFATESWNGLIYHGAKLHAEIIDA